MAIAAHLVGSILIGSASLFFIFAAAWGTKEQLTIVVLVAGLAPAIVLGAVGGWIYRQRLPWLATSYSWPMLATGVTCLTQIPDDGWGLLLWFALGVTMFVLSLASAACASAAVRRTKANVE